MPYADPTDPPAEAVPPKHCPFCRSALVRRWVGHRQHSHRQGYSAVAYTLFVCEHCEIAVKVCRLPKKPMRATKKAARGDVHKQERARPAALRRILC